MKLYCFPVAPNPTKVRVYLAEKGITIDEVLVSLPKGEHRSEENLRRNPMGQLPILELDDGSYLTESLPIIEYFEELHPDPPMIGREPLERARVRELERIADGVLSSIGRIIHATNSPLGLPPVPEIAEAARKQLPGPLTVLDTRMGDRPFVAGDRPTIADCTLYAAFFFAGFGGVEIDPGHAHLARWYDSFSKRPSAEAASRRPPRV
jgi:glutathione S-transferase